MRHCNFRSFFSAGFESSCHVLPSGKRLDMLAATHHDVFADHDYQRLQSVGIRTARDGIRWHRIETRPYEYDWSSVLPMLGAAQARGVQVIWDLCHYGWPDDLDIFSPEFVDRFRALARAFASLVFNETDDTPYFTPINEISFLAWGGGDEGLLNPFEYGRGFALKRQLVRSAIAAIDAIRDVAPHARFVHVDPLIHVVTDAGASEEERKAALAKTEAQFEAFDMLSGRICPELGGNPRYLDITGANYYVHNQWILNGPFIERWDARFRPLHRLLGDFYHRYRKPVFIAETGIEDERRPQWLAYVSEEIILALESGIPVEGICLYPVINHPGWDDGRHCQNGLWDYCNESGSREIYRPLADELTAQSERIQNAISRLAAGNPAAAAFALQAQEASAGGAV